MVQITEELLRKRSEHNEGMLSSLEEITLHQYSIEKIDPILHQKCRELRILYFQNNLIGKIENLYHLKELRYLNMAINNVVRIEGLESCERLQKLDLTVNYIQDLLSVESLQKNPELTDLYLTGNPCCQYPGYRLFVIGKLPQLKRLDGKEVSKSERLRARQQWIDIEREVTKSQNDWIKKQEEDIANAPKFNEKGERLYSNDPKSRIEATKSLDKEQDDAGLNRDKSVDGSGIGELDRIGSKGRKSKRLTPEEEIEKYGKVMMCNEGDWKFTLKEDPSGANLLLDIPVGKFLSTALIHIDLQPTYANICIKGKYLRLRFEKEINVEKSVAQRGKIKGNLKLTMPILNPDKVIKNKKTKEQPVEEKKPRKKNTNLGDREFGVNSGVDLKFM